MEKKNVTNYRIFLKRSASYRAMVDRMLIIERKYLTDLAQKRVSSISDHLEGMRLSLSIASYYIIENEIYRNIFTISNETILKSSRKYLALSIDYLSKIYTTDADLLYREEDIRRQAHAEIEEFESYKIVTRVAFYLDYLDSFFDIQSRWHWNVLDLSFDLALIYKNTFNFKSIVSKLDIRAENGYERKLYLLQLKTYLNEVADGLRMKYEITRMPTDMDKAVSVLEILRQIHIALNEIRDAETQARKMEVWQAKVVSDQKI